MFSLSGDLPDYAPEAWEDRVPAAGLTEEKACVRLSTINLIEVALICWGHRNKVPQTGGLKRQTFSDSSRGQKYEIKVSAGLVSSAASLLDF